MDTRSGDQTFLKHGKCLSRRIDNIENLKEEVKAWCKSRNNMNTKVNWQFTTKDALVKLKSIYPKLEA